jgi:hypothetical protein
MAFFVVSKNQFEEIKNVEKFDLVTGQRKKMKERILDVVKESVKIHWFRFRKVMAVMDEIIYKLTDRGFSFNGRETLAKKCQVSLSTVDKAIRLLKDSDLFFVAYRENSKSNSVKTPIFFYKNHQLFSEHAAILNIEENKEKNKEENAGIPCESKGEADEKEATYLRPNTFKDIYKRTEDASLDHSFVSDSVPKDFVKAVKPFFNDARKIEEYWKMVRISNYHTRYDDETMLQLAVHAFKQMIGKLKRGKVKKNPFAYFYGIVQKKLDELYFQDGELRGFFAVE